MRLSRLLRLLVLALLVAAPAANAAPADRKFVTLRGRVADASGAPLADVRIEAAGTREAIALTSPEGRFGLTLDLGALNQIQVHPVMVSVRAHRVGYRIQVAGGAPELVLELRLGEGAPGGAGSGSGVMQARSNYGIIAGALLDALAPQGDRTATIHVNFVAERGSVRDSSALIPAEFQSVAIAEPWLATPAAVTAPKGREPAAQPRREEPPVRTPEPAPAVRREEPPAPREEPVAERKVSKKKPKRQTPKSRAPAARAESTTASDPASPDPAPPGAPPESRAAAERPSPFAPPRPAPVPASHADSLRLAQQRTAIAAAQAQRDSLWAHQRAQSMARKAVTDSVRRIREAAEDSARRARYGLPPRPAPVVRAPAGERASAATSPTRSDRERAAAPAKSRPSGRDGGFSPSVGGGGAPSGLQRVDVRDGGKPAEASDAELRAELEADTCTCRVRGTIETEFHRLLASPLRVEVSIRELPALRDTIELFMGSPRAFEFERVPCGRWSLALRPFSDRPFGVTTPEEVAPFDCRKRGLRQVRIVIQPLKPSR